MRSHELSAPKDPSRIPAGGRTLTDADLSEVTVCFLFVFFLLVGGPCDYSIGSVSHLIIRENLEGRTHGPTVRSPSDLDYFSHNS